MKLGENILSLRKKNKLSQEELSEKVGVTRQTISNWELGVTEPTPSQLKILSKIFQVSVDELLDNNIDNLLIEKVSNTEKLAGIIIKILKVIGIAFVVFLMIDVIAFILFSSNGYLINVESSATTICQIEDNEYEIEFGTDKYFRCSNCSDKMNKEIKKIIDFNNIDDSMNNIENYFESNNGTCE